jgi:hypothetical protein
MINLMGDKQEQKSGNESINIMIGGDVNNGLTSEMYSLVKVIAMDVYKANFYELAGEAKT